MPSLNIIKTCKAYHKEYKTRHKESRFCSLACVGASKARPKKEITKKKNGKRCKVCGKALVGDQSKFCSITCNGIAQRKKRDIDKSTKYCAYCGKEIVKKKAAYKYKYCSSKCFNLQAKERTFDKLSGMTYQQKRAVLLKRKEYRDWRTAVFTRDGYKCRICDSTGYLEAHHIIPWANAPSLRYNVRNGFTLCKKCHKKVHKRSKKKV